MVIDWAIHYFYLNRESHLKHCVFSLNNYMSLNTNNWALTLMYHLNCNDKYTMVNDLITCRIIIFYYVFIELYLSRVFRIMYYSLNNRIGICASKVSTKLYLTPYRSEIVMAMSKVIGLWTTYYFQHFLQDYLEILKQSL